MGNVKQGTTTTQPGGLAQGAGFSAANPPTATTQQQQDDDRAVPLNMPKQDVKKIAPPKYARPAVLAPRTGPALPPQPGMSGAPIINPPQPVVPQGMPGRAPVQMPAPMPAPAPTASAPTAPAAPVAPNQAAQPVDLQQQNDNLKNLLQQLLLAKKAKATPME